MLIKLSVLMCQMKVRQQAAQNLPKMIIPAALRRDSSEFPVVEYEWPYTVDNIGHNIDQPEKLWKISSTITCFLVGFWGKVLLTVLNKTIYNNLSTLNEAIFKRPEGRPLITVSNHESCIDDPCLIGALMTNKQLLENTKMRWGLAAHDICYLKPWHGWIMSRGKCIPIVRGMGIYQRSVDFVIDRLNMGNWLHIFPEGKVNMEREDLHRLKWGVGRIISDMKVLPIVVPFWHVGMADVLPNHKPYYPRVGKKILINVGNPIDLNNIMKTIEDKSVMEKRKIITDVIENEMKKLRMETLELAKNDGMNV